MTAEIQSFGEQLEAISTLYPDAVLLGSVGRAAIMQEDLPLRRPNGTLRDLDALRLRYDSTQTGRPFKGVPGPCVVDDVFHEWLKLGQDTSWLVCPYAGNIQEEVLSEVFSPMHHTFAGTAIRTLSPHTQLQLQYLMGPLRSKDIEPVARFSAFVATQPELLPHDAYEPFRRFREAVLERKQRRGLRYAEKIGGLLLSCVPNQVKTVARPTFRRITHKVIDLTSR